MEQKEKNKWIESGGLASQIMKKARQLCKPQTPLLEIAEKLEAEVEKLKVKWAFPLNLSINEIAAHDCPLHEDKRVANGLLKIDLGISVDGYISDTASSVDLSPEQKFKPLIKSSEDALKEAIKAAKFGIPVNQIGKVIHDSIVKSKFSPIRNLSGHKMERFQIHAGINIPNYDNNSAHKIEEGIYAIEPFSTAGEGVVQDGKPSGVYMLKQMKPARDSKTREILEFIEKEYSTLPFSSRWIIKKFGLRSLLSLKALEQQEILHQFKQLVEKSRSPVSHAEHTLMVEKDKVSVLTSDIP